MTAAGEENARDLGTTADTVSLASSVRSSCCSGCFFSSEVVEAAASRELAVTLAAEDSAVLTEEGDLGIVDVAEEDFETVNGGIVVDAVGDLGTELDIDERPGERGVPLGKVERLGEDKAREREVVREEVGERAVGEVGATGTAPNRAVGEIGATEETEAEEEKKEKAEEEEEGDEGGAPTLEGRLASIERFGRVSVIVVTEVRGLRGGIEEKESETETRRAEGEGGGDGWGAGEIGAEAGSSLSLSDNG